MSLFNSVSSNNTNNTTVTDAGYSASLRSSTISNSWIPTESKLSRGKKGQIQRIFAGEPLNNLCNVYTYNETSKLWYHENTIQGDPNRNGPVLYPPTSLSSNTSTIGGITYTTTNSVSTTHPTQTFFYDANNIDSYKAFGPFNTESWKSESVGNVIQSYPESSISPAGGVPSNWVDGAYYGYQGVGGVSGEWIKIQLSTAIQPSKFRLQKGGIYNNEPATMTILGSNDDTNWTNLGNFTNSTAPLPALEDWIDTLTISNTYTYFAFVFTSRRTTNWTSGGVYPNTFRDPEYIEIYSLSLFTNYPSEDFGRSLDGTDNADMVAIGAPGTWFGSVSNITGYARVFTKDSSGNGWTQRGSEVSQTGGFGHSVALSQYDGNILVVGAPFYNTLTLQNGTAPAFDTAGGVYPTTEINYYNTPVSEGKVYIYKWNGSNYTLQQTLDSPSSPLSSSVIQPSWKGFYFGFSLGITDIGDKIIIGEPSFRHIWSILDQTTSAFHTGNAHVYDNFSVLSSGTTWTSNVSITSIIGITGINSGGRDHDYYPTKIRWGDAVGTSVDINRAGTRILAGAPLNYGSLPESDDRLESAGRILTFDWDPINGVWKGMGLDEYSQHINVFKAYTLQGWSTRFDGSGRRIISGCKGSVVWTSVIEPSNNSGIVNVFDWNGDNWVLFPNETIEVLNYNVNSNVYAMTLHSLGESVSVDGEGEMIAIGKSEHHYSVITPPSGGLRPNEFSVNNITYIGGATTTVAGSDSQVNTGGSNVWVYNIAQSMVVKGNVTVGGYIQGTGISIGSNDNSDTSRKSIYFGGTKGDNRYELSVIENRVYENLEKSELLLYKGGNGFDYDNVYNETAGEIEPGPDRIRLKSSQVCFDLNPGDDRTLDNTSIKMQQDSSGNATLGINLSASVLPSEAIDVVGKIKSRYGFIGPGTSLTGIGLDHINLAYSPKLDNYGSASSSSYWGEAVVGSSLTYPLASLTSSDISESSPELVTSTSSHYALKSMASLPSSYPYFYHSGWIYGSFRSYKVWDGVDIGDYTFFDIGSYLPITTYYLDSAEKVPGFKGEWLEFTIPERVIVEELDFYVIDRFHLPRAYTFFGTNDGGVTYNVIKELRFKNYNWGSDNSWNNIFTRTIDASVDDPYNTFLIIIHSNSGSQDLTDKSGPPLDSRMTINSIRIKAREVTYTQKLKIDNTGKIGILNTNPSYPLDVTGDINCTGTLSKGSGSFKIDHPLAIMSNTHNLYHSFIEGPQADLMYRGKVDLVNGGASINLDTVSNMTSGTFEALNRNVQCFTSNESDWDAVKGSVSGNTLTISCQNASSTANVSWLVIGERKDKHMYDTSWTDDDGFVIPEQLK